MQGTIPIPVCAFACVWDRHPIQNSGHFRPPRRPPWASNQSPRPTAETAPTSIEGDGLGCPALTRTGRCIIWGWAASVQAMPVVMLLHGSIFSILKVAG